MKLQLDDAMGLAGLVKWLSMLTMSPAGVIHSTDLKPY